MPARAPRPEATTGDGTGPVPRKTCKDAATNARPSQAGRQDAKDVAGDETATAQDETDSDATAQATTTYAEDVRSPCQTATVRRHSHA